MIAKGTPLVDYYQLWVDNKTGKVLEVVYIIEKFIRAVRREGFWEPFEGEETPGMYDDTRIITLEKEDAIELNVTEDFDSGKQIDIAAVAEYETGKYYD